MVRVLITGSREASPAMLAKVEEVILWVKRQGYTLLVGDAPGVDAHVRVCAEALSVPTTVYGAYGRLRGRRRSQEQVVVVRRRTWRVIASWPSAATSAWRCGTGGRAARKPRSSMPGSWVSASS